MKKQTATKQEQTKILDQVNLIKQSIDQHYSYDLALLDKLAQVEPQTMPHVLSEVLESSFIHVCKHKAQRLLKLVLQEELYEIDGQIFILDDHLQIHSHAYDFFMDIYFTNPSTVFFRECYKTPEGNPNEAPQFELKEYIYAALYDRYLTGTDLEKQEVINEFLMYKFPKASWVRFTMKRLPADKLNHYFLSQVESIAYHVRRRRALHEECVKGYEEVLRHRQVREERMKQMANKFIQDGYSVQYQ